MGGRYCTQNPSQRQAHTLPESTTTPALAIETCRYHFNLQVFLQHWHDGQLLRLVTIHEYFNSRCPPSRAAVVRFPLLYYYYVRHAKRILG
jgi:hypothetical protein